MKPCEIKLLRKICAICTVRRTHYRYRRRGRWNRQHCLCFSCFPAARDRIHAVLAQHHTLPAAPVYQAVLLPSEEGEAILVEEFAAVKDDSPMVALVS
jgi:hypothetical protein